MAAVKLDENVPDSVATLLRAAGYDVALARDEQLVGADDERVLIVAGLEGRVLVTLDQGQALARNPRQPCTISMGESEINPQSAIRIPKCLNVC